jgi:hypothetical protein
MVPDMVTPAGAGVMAVMVAEPAMVRVQPVAILVACTVYTPPVLKVPKLMVVPVPFCSVTAVGPL